MQKKIFRSYKETGVILAGTFCDRNTLLARYPELIDEWCDIENYALDLDPDAIIPTNTKIAFWNCSICKHTYTKKIADYVLAKRRGHNPCPYCNGRNPRRVFY